MARLASRSLRRVSLSLGLFVSLFACKPAEAPTAPEPTAPAAEAVDPAAQELQARLAWLEKQLEQARVDTHVPGMAIAIVKDDEVIYAHGFGMSDLEKQTPVTPETTFAIGSSTKAFSSALVGMMVDEGKLDWDDPISKYLPDFNLQIDGNEGDEVTIRDLLSHRAGFARMSVLWAAGKMSRERIFAYASKAEPISRFRDEFHYNNITYMAGSLAAAKAAGMPWEELLRTRLLEPLGMTHTNVDYASAQADPKYSKGYTWRSDLEKYEEAPMRKIDVAAPAGAINSSVLDMTKWIRLQLGYGSFEGKELVSKKSILATHRDVISIGPGVDYGMGWMLREWEEKKVVEHGGNIDGFSAAVGLMPEEKLGFVLLTNASMTGLQSGVLNMVWEALLTDAYTQDPNPSGEDLSVFVGEYVPQIPGFDQNMKVMTKAGKLAVDVPGQTVYSLKAPDDDDFRYFEATDEVAISFVKNDAGEVTTMLLHQGGMSFEAFREGYTPPVEVTEEQAKDLLGYYESDKGLTGDIVIHNGRLAFDIHKQMTMDLEPVEKDGEYHFRPNYEMFIVFDRDEKKKDEVVGLTLFQDGKTTEFKRGKGLRKPSIEELHKKRKTDKRQAALEKAGFVRMDQSLHMHSAGLTAKSSAWFDAGGRLRQEVDYGEAGEGIVVLHEGGGWRESAFEPRSELDGIRLEQVKFNHPAYLYGDWRKVFSEEKVLRAQQKDGRVQWVIELKGGDFPATVMTLDAKTGDVVEVKSFEVAAGGMRVPITTTLSDYKTVKGMRIPHQMVMRTPQAGKVTSTVTKVETGLAPDSVVIGPMPKQ